MKNIIYKSNSSYGDMFNDAIDFFRPLFYDEKLDAMKTDITENSENYVLEIELPGFAKENITVDFENEYLTVSAEKKESDGEKKTYIRKERSVSCQRSYYVGDIDENKITAKYENGILYLTIPKKEKQKPQRKGILIE